ncbi:MAG: ATP-binding protein [Deltaproteobacteria bacterium]|nr:ATP-binding protein [Deltaproteobacteria bacterium]
MIDKIIERQNTAQIKKSLNEKFITALIGPRQVGKSTLLERLLVKEDTLFLNFDSGEVRQKVLLQESWIQEQLEQKIKAPLSKLQKKLTLYIDEVQKLPESFEILKQLYDQFHPKLKIIISGSSSLLIKKHSAESLAGRIRYFYMQPFTFEEASRLEDLKKDEGPDSQVQEWLENLLEGKFSEKMGRKIESDKRFIKQSFARKMEEWCLWGLLPGRLHLKDEENRLLYLRDYIDTYIEKDMRATERIGSLNDYRKLTRLMGGKLGDLINYSNIASTLGIHRQTVKEYLNLLDESLLAYRLSSYSESIFKQITKSEKNYFIDNGLAYYFADLKPLDILRASGEMGHLYENLILSEFKKQATLLPVPLHFFYWRQSGHSPAEVDLILSYRGNILPIEIKGMSKVDGSDLKGLKIFATTLNEKKKQILYSLVIYPGDFHYDKQEKIFFIPDWFFS